MAMRILELITRYRTENTQRKFFVLFVCTCNGDEVMSDEMSGTPVYYIGLRRKEERYWVLSNMKVGSELKLIVI